MSEKYKVSEWNVAASDDRGHNVKLVFNVQPFIAKQCEIFLQSKRFPYDSLSALLRHAVYRHCQWLGALESDVKTVLGQAKVVNTFLDDEQQAAEFSSTFQKLGQIISKHTGAGDSQRAAKIVADTRQYLDDMPDGFWKTKYLDELDAKYGGLLKSVMDDSRVDFTTFTERAE